MINVNIGWASAYYGDFNTAIKYFDKALAIDKNYSEALEGEALIAFQRGDVQKLYGCLAKEVNFMGGAAGATDAGPSDNFATFCATQYAMNQESSDNQSSDPNNDHTFDNTATDNGSSPNPPPGADVDQVGFPELKKVFVADPAKIRDALAQYIRWSKKEGDVFRQKGKALQTEYKSLKPLVQPPHMKNGIAIVYPVSFRKYVELYTELNISFDKREGWYVSKLNKKLQALNKDVVSRDMDMMNQYDKELLACSGKKDACVRAVNCKWLPKMYKSKNGDLEAIAQLWDDYYNHIVDVVNWYIGASAPLVSRVHEEGWNRYLNDERKFKVWTAIFKAYSWWGAALGNIHSPVDILIKQPAPSCAPVEVAGVKPPDPYSKPPKHIKEFEGPCYDIKNSAFGIGLSCEQTCHATTISFGAGPFSAFYTHVDDPVYAQNYEYTNELGTTISASKEVNIVSMEGKGNEEKSLVSGKVGIQGSVDLKFDNNWDFVSGSSSVGASADIGGINLGGISATRTAEMVDGQLNVNPLSVTATTPLQ